MYKQVVALASPASRPRVPRRRRRPLPSPSQALARPLPPQRLTFQPRRGSWREGYQKGDGGGRKDSTGVGRAEPSRRRRLCLSSFARQRRRRQPRPQRLGLFLLLLLLVAPKEPSAHLSCLPACLAASFTLPPAPLSLSPAPPPLSLPFSRRRRPPGCLHAQPPTTPRFFFPPSPPPALPPRPALFCSALRLL